MSEVYQLDSQPSCGCVYVGVQRIGYPDQEYVPIRRCDKHADPAVLAKRLALIEVDDIDHQTGLSKLPGWFPVSRVPIPRMEETEL